MNTRQLYEYLRDGPVRKLCFPLDRRNFGPDVPDGGWQNLCITAKLAEPIIDYGDPIAIDGILAYAAWRIIRHVPPSMGRYHLPPEAAPWVADFRLPLRKTMVEPDLPSWCNRRLLTPTGELWWWSASMAIIEPVRQSKHEIRKRPDTGRMARLTKSPSINIGAGAVKAYDLAFPTVLVDQITWYVVGQLDAIRFMLADVTHIGKKRHHGLGRVLSWSVDPHHEDRTLIDADGNAARHLPACLVGEEGESLGLRPPYWHPSRRVPVWRAGYPMRVVPPSCPGARSI